MSEETEALEDITPEQVAESIRDYVLASTRSLRHRGRSVRPGELRALAQWERELTSNYGVEK